MDEEEESFARTLYRGEALFDKYAAKAQAEGKTTLNGIDVWRLYDTFGFPGDLTRIMAEERGLTVDEDAFEKAKQESYEISKAGGKNKGKETVKLDVHDLGALEQNADVPKTNDDAKFCKSWVTFLTLNITNIRSSHSARQHHQPGQGHLPKIQVCQGLVRVGSG